ncbi:MAG: DUF1566 domain-containing protein [Desulfotalea sp.]
MKKFLLALVLVVLTGCTDKAVNHSAANIGEEQTYTKLGYKGKELADSATLADGWLMTRDNITGLVWELKSTDNSLQDKKYRFPWCDTNPETNGGNSGTCSGKFDTTEYYINSINNNSYAGYSDWHLPTMEELISIVGIGRKTPDRRYFPN